ncbi:MAG TPA: response regulator transcription factor [Nocardioidaceae bacterium]|nr:response regulator transcription factor [Nocardioidaceae bacterium]
MALVEDHAVLADALRLILADSGLEVVAVPLTAGETTATLVQDVLRARAEVVLLDLQLGPAGDGGRVIEPLTAHGQRVVVLTGVSDPVRWGECLAKGAVTVLLKSGQLDPIVTIIHRVAQGLPVLPPARREELVQLWNATANAAGTRQKRLSYLTPREAEVLRQLVHGKRVAEVAREAYVSEATVRTQVKSILAKLGVSSQLAAVAMARDAGWGSPREPP